MPQLNRFFCCQDQVAARVPADQPGPESSSPPTAAAATAAAEWWGWWWRAPGATTTTATAMKIYINIL